MGSPIYRAEDRWQWIEEDEREPQVNETLANALKQPKKFDWIEEDYTTAMFKDLKKASDEDMEEFWNKPVEGR